jgi:hypothetical protein
VTPLLLGLEGSVLDVVAEGAMAEPAHTITIGVLSSSGGWKQQTPEPLRRTSRQPQPPSS